MGVHEGHRRRVKEKIVKSGLNALADHEVLEALLFYAIPYRDTNPIAHDLLTRSGSLEALLHLPAAAVSSVRGCGSRTAEFLMLFSEAGRRAFITTGKPMVYDTPDAMRALALRTVERNLRECTYFMLFDNSFSLLDSRLLHEGYFASAAVKPSLIAEPALMLHASCAVLVTRHESRIACPDRYEMETLRFLQTSLDKIGVHLLEYYMVGGNLVVPILKNHRTSFPVPIASAETLPEEKSKYKSHEILPAASPYAERLSDRALLTALFEYLMPLDNGETAQRLHAAFDTLPALLSADNEELLSCGATPHAISFLRLLLPAYGRCLRAGYPADFHFDSKEDIGAYFTSCFAGAETEMVYLLLLREDKTVIDCRCMAVGSTNSANLNTRALLEAALFAEARYVAIAHNHPNGTPMPSEADKNTTNLLNEAFGTIGISLLDHVVVVGNTHTSISEGKNTDAE